MTDYDDQTERAQAEAREAEQQAAAAVQQSERAPEYVQRTDYMTAPGAEGLNLPSGAQAPKPFAVPESPMQKWPDIKLIEDIGLSDRVRSALASAGILYVGQLRRLTPKRLKKILSETLVEPDMIYIRQLVPHEKREGDPAEPTGDDNDDESTRLGPGGSTARARENENYQRTTAPYS